MSGAGTSAIFLKAAGLWLRCFLGAALVVATLGVSRSVGAQVDCVQNHRLTVGKLAGQVLDPFGIPIPNAEISVFDHDGRRLEDRTKADGRFSIAGAPAMYKFEAKLTGFEKATVDVSVQRDLSNSLDGRELHVILGLASMYCPWVTTSTRDFEYNIRANIKRSKESEQKNATQK